MARPGNLKVGKSSRAGIVLYTEGAGLGEATVIESTTVGTTPSSLVCNCPTFKKLKPGQARWCYHVEKTYVDALDAKIWNPLGHIDRAEPPRDLPSLIEVTVFVKTKCLLVVALDEADDNGLRKAYVVKSSALEQEPPEFIGFIGRYEGRYVIRKMLQEWIIECLDVRNLNMECPSPFHFGERRIPPAESVTTPAQSQPWVKYIAQVASILTTGFCSTCHLDSYVPEID